jgi:hypothetical protein
VKVGDLVRCNFQPRCGDYNKEKNGFVYGSVPRIENEIGLIIKEACNYRSVPRFIVLFGHIGYEHTLIESVLEDLNESR